jgi:hypothetical protein
MLAKRDPPRSAQCNLAELSHVFNASEFAALFLDE